MTRRLCLVTGASAGIGAAFAREFARHGFDVFLTARRVERLETLAAEIRLNFGVEAFVVAADLAEPGAVDRVLAAVAAEGRWSTMPAMACPAPMRPPAGRTSRPSCRS